MNFIQNVDIHYSKIVNDIVMTFGYTMFHNKDFKKNRTQEVCNSQIFIFRLYNKLFRTTTIVLKLNFSRFWF